MNYPATLLGSSANSPDAPEIIGPTPAPFDIVDEVGLQIVDLISRGYETDYIATQIGLTHGSTKNRRSFIIRGINALNMAHVVRIGCEVDLFGVELDIEPPEAEKICGKQLSILDIASRGHNAFYTGREVNMNPNAVRMRRWRMLGQLGAQTFPHAVRIAWEHNLLPVSATDTTDS